MWLKIILEILLVSLALGNPLLLNDDDVIIERKFSDKFSSDVESFIESSPKTYRLPNDSFPLKYDLYLKTDIDRGIFNFSGSVVIRIKILRETNEVVLHSKQLEIIAIHSVDPETLYEKDELTSTYILSHEFLVIDLGRIINEGVTVAIKIEYTGELRDDQEGFYRGSYMNENNEVVWYATTQFEIAEARHAMPCYDEPGIRAPIKLTISHHPNYFAVANMPIITSVTDNDQNYNRTLFQETPPMQTYLLAFLISDFKFKEAPSGLSRISQNIYATPQAIDEGHADYAASIVGAVVRELEAYIGFNYTLTKLDHVALTVFKHGAMENFGLITYIDNGLLLDPNTPERLRISSENGIVGLIAHETAHQWFGDIVSPTWWSYTWLNEGFATLFTNFISHQIYPDRNLLNNFVRSNIPAAFSTDENPATWSMNQYTEDPKLLWDKFNNIGYSKSGCVLRMFQEALTWPTFGKGLKYYMNTMQYKAATPDDLHRELQKAYNEDFPGTPLNIGVLMATWENQPGYPMVSVSVSNGIINLSQSRYPITNGEIYSIPLTYATKSNRNFQQKTPKQWMTSINSSITPSDFKAGDWIIFNNQQVGYYRVDYSTELWHAIIRQLNENHREIHEINRAILQDEIYLAWKVFKRVTSADVLESVLYFHQEDEAIAWTKVNKFLSELNLRLRTTGHIYEHFQEYIEDITKPHLQRLGFEGTDTEHTDITSLRNSVKNWNCLVGNVECLQHELTKLLRYLDSGVMTQSINFCNSLTLLDEANFTQILIGVTTNRSHTYMSNYLNNLACNEKEVNLRKLLDAVIDTTNILTPSERLNLLRNTYSKSRISLELAIDFIHNNYEVISSYDDRNNFGTLILDVAKYVNPGKSQEDFESLLATLRNNLYISNQEFMAINQVINEITIWHDKEYQDIWEWFGDRETTTEGSTQPSTSTATQESTSPSTAKPNSAGSLIISFKLLAIAIFMCIIFNKN